MTGTANSPLPAASPGGSPAREGRAPPCRRSTPGPERAEGPARGPGRAHQPARHQAAEHGGGRRTPSDASLLRSLHERRLPEINAPPLTPGPPSHFRSAAGGAEGRERRGPWGGGAGEARRCGAARPSPAGGGGLSSTARRPPALPAPCPASWVSTRRVSPEC